MTESTQLPLPAAPGPRAPGGGLRRSAWAALIALVAVIAGTAVLGVATGFLWASVAPRALAVVIARGSANVANPETSAFIAADGWFTLLTALGGVVSGLLGYALAVRRHGALAMTGVLLGALVAALIAMWVGQRSGTAAFNHSLSIDRPGTLLHVPLALGGRGPLAFWPLAAALTVGGIELVGLLRERRRRPAPMHAYGAQRFGAAAAPLGPYGFADRDGRPAPGGPVGQSGSAPPTLAGPREPGPAQDPLD